MIKELLNIILLNLLKLVNKINKNNSIILINGNHYIDVKYMFYDKEYICKLKISDEPIFLRSLKIYNENLDDVSKYVLKCAGPNYDFHSIELTPKDFGYTKLTVYEDDNFICDFFENDIINL